MLDKSFFKKRFSIGLTLDSNFEDFSVFLNKYHYYIDNFYFSLPMGDKFHAREKVIEQMRNPQKTKMFWEMLALIKKYRVKLELVLNNGNVAKEDVIQSEALLKEHNIDIDLIGLTDDLYEIIKEVFPNKKIVYSFKNHTHTIEDFKGLEHCYDEIVLGRQNIRNIILFDFIHENLNSNVILLLNNGCSHICGGCSSLMNCHASYYRMKFNYSSEYIYALQSILPYEIHAGLLDVSNVKLFKISSRNASLKYLDDCLNSYINCIEEEYIHKDTNNYVLWGRLAWHIEYYSEFSLERIKALKKEIYSSEAISQNHSYVYVGLDLRDKYIFGSDSDLNLNAIEIAIKQKSYGIPYRIEECYIGVSNCKNLLKHIVINKIDKLVSELKEVGKRVYFELPKLDEDDIITIEPILDHLRTLKNHVDCIIVNDIDTENFIKIKYGYPIGYGVSLSQSTIDNSKNDYMSGNDIGFGQDLLKADSREQYQMQKVQFLVCDMPEGGLCISVTEDINIKANINLIQEYENICHQKDCTQCDACCITRTNNVIESADGQKRYIRCNSIYKINKLTNNIRKTIIENRLSVILFDEEF